MCGEIFPYIDGGYETPVIEPVNEDVRKALIWPYSLNGTVDESDAAIDRGFLCAELPGLR